MYSIVLTAHSWVRWLALAGGIGATLTLMTDERTDMNSRAGRLGLLFMVSLDIQLLLGLFLYLVLSPLTTELMRNVGAAMRDPGLRFWAVEHATMMFVAVILVHVGRVLARKAPTPQSQRMRLLACFGFATLLMILAIPWPGLANGRPLFRF